MDKKELADLKDRHTRYMAEYKSKSGRKVAEYLCPMCDSKIETIRPTKDLVADKGYWDGVKTCPECGEQSFVSVWPDGTTTVSKMPLPENYIP